MVQQNFTAATAAPALRRRLICMVYEAMLLFGVVFVAGMIFDVWTQSRHALTLRHARETWLFFVLGVYFVFFWSRSGQTLAMKTWSIKVIDDTRPKLPVTKAIVRYCLAWMWFLPGLAIAYQLELKAWYAVTAVTINVILWSLTTRLDKDGQFLHDKLAKTRLVHVEVKLSTDTRQAN
ncbi:RDD family protein [Undibacterium sp. Xuan67W]|uniref:RDD family protein n=1 Tax=Undibacterium sp. Xuan67W TaxID=3413057 RepID=UPI003BEFCBA7